MTNVAAQPPASKAAFLPAFVRLLRARVPFVYVTTWEEDRLLDELIGAAESVQPARSVFVWTCVDGLAPLDEPPIEGTDNPVAALIYIEQVSEPSLFVLKDFHVHLRDEDRSHDNQRARTNEQSAKLVDELARSFLFSNERLRDRVPRSEIVSSAGPSVSYMWSPRHPRCRHESFSRVSRTTVCDTDVRAVAPSPSPVRASTRSVAPSPSASSRSVLSRARITRRRGKNRAIVAIGRSILVIVWALLSDPDAQFVDLGPTTTPPAPTPSARSATTSASCRPSATR